MMATVNSVEQVRGAVAALRKAGGRIALVPTMGALHAGHRALVAAGRQGADHVVTSIFVNPLQFGPNEDLARYPRTETADRALLSAAGCALLWMPTPADLYPAGFATSVRVAGVSERWDGAARPGHFEGVATVVAKLLIAVMPDVALFGEKDFQQLAVIRRMVADLALPVAIIGVPTVRDGDGLALSSRNAYLSADERQRALALPRGLIEAAAAIRGGAGVAATLAGVRESLAAAGFDPVDYVALIDAASLAPIDSVQEAPMRLIAAARIGATRLIDNVAV